MKNYIKGFLAFYHLINAVISFVTVVACGLTFVDLMKKGIERREPHRDYRTYYRPSIDHESEETPDITVKGFGG